MFQNYYAFDIIIHLNNLRLYSAFLRRCYEASMPTQATFFYEEEFGLKENCNALWARER